MKHSIPRRRTDERGSLLITAAVAAAVIGILVGGMLTYISNEYRLNLRSHRWTQGLYLAEAGADMSFAEFNNYYITGSNYFAASRGWSYEAGGTPAYVKVVTDFRNANGEIIGTVSNRVENPASITPYVKAFASCTTTPSGPLVYRGVKCHLANSGRFPAGMVAKLKVDMNGNTVTTDSYDSSDVSKSTNYKYDSAKRQAHGDIASNDTIINTPDITIGNADIYGQVLTSPVGLVTIGAGGSVGDLSSRYTDVASAQNAGWVRNDFAVDIPDALLPSGAASWSSAGNINSSVTLGSGDYKASGVDLKSSDNLTIDGNVRLYVAGNINMIGTSKITINSGGTLTVYVSGNTKIAGNGVVNNSASDLNLQLYALKPTGNQAQTFDLNGNGYWSGLVYAPYASVTLNGGGANGDMSGAIVGKSITLNGQVQFHYDENLRKHGPNAGYDIASWRSMHYDPSQSKWVNDY